MLLFAAMKLIGIELLHGFAARRPAARTWIQSWVYETRHANWSCPQDIKNRYRSASFVGKHVIFNVKGNDFRMATVIAYATKVVLIKWIGSHDDYAKVNWEIASDENSRN